jgi:HAD superfamily hydrolase (TIGR01509 family)
MEVKTAAMKFKAFAFDLDGTLVDSKIDFEGICRDLQIPKGSNILEEIAPWSQEDRTRAHQIIHQYEQKGAEESKPIRDAIDFLKHLQALRLPFAVFTRNSRTTALKTIEKHSLGISLVVSRDDADPKPHPAGLLKIINSFSVKPEETLFVGDYIHDLKAGLAAGVPTALYLPETADFEIRGACFTFDHYDQLKAHCFG